jgi:hypothetical protein
MYEKFPANPVGTGGNMLQNNGISPEKVSLYNQQVNKGANNSFGGGSFPY